MYKEHTVLYIIHIHFCPGKKAYEKAAKRLKLDNEREKETVIPKLWIGKNVEKRKEDKLQNLKLIS